MCVFVFVEVLGLCVEEGDAGFAEGDSPRRVMKCVVVELLSASKFFFGLGGVCFLRRQRGVFFFCVVFCCRLGVGPPRASSRWSLLCCCRVVRGASRRRRLHSPVKPGAGWLLLSPTNALDVNVDMVSYCGCNPGLSALALALVVSVQASVG